MDEWILRAKTFAETAAKKSREIAVDTAKYSERFAKDAVKQSRALAEEAAKKTDIGIKALVKELNTAANGPVRQSQATEAQLEVYGVTADLREFVRGMTIKTFKDFPPESVDNTKSEKADSAWVAPAFSERADLTPWQEKHALLVLQSVEEISDFRYLLCPRRMTERRFWRIYFLLVHSHLAPYEAAAASQAGERKEVEMSRVSSAAPPPSAQPPAEPTESRPAKEQESDLDDYLMASGEEEEEGEFDPEDFDHFVNSGADSDEGETEGKKAVSGGTSKGTTPSSGLSSDGELVEMPTSESAPRR